MTSTAERRRPGWGRALSPRTVKARIGVGQVWEDREQRTWTVQLVWRKDELAIIVRSDGALRGQITFSELGKSYRLIEGGAVIPEQVSARLLVADVGSLHLCDGRESLCGHVHRIEAIDVHEPEAGVRVWAQRAWQRCQICERMAEHGEGAPVGP